MTNMQQTLKVTQAFIYLVSSRSNTAVTVTSFNGSSVIFHTTAGAAIWGSLDRNFRRTPDALKILGAKVLKDLQKHGINLVRIIFKSTKFSRFLFLKELLRNNTIKILSCTDSTGVPHNGCYLRKARRYKHHYKKNLRKK